MSSDRSVFLEEARIVFRNFQGKEGKYNREGDRNFAVLLEEEDAHNLERAGWNVKYLAARDEGDEPQAYLSVAVSYKNVPPKVCLITSKGRTYLGEEEVEVIDWVDIQWVDMIIHPYEWSVNGKSGIKAYLRSLAVIIHEDYIDLKYSDLDELPGRNGRSD